MSCPYKEFNCKSEGTAFCKTDCLGLKKTADLSEKMLEFMIEQSLSYPKGDITAQAAVQWINEKAENK